jgi:hypothetical protein
MLSDLVCCRCRHYIAQLTGFNSYLQQVQQRLAISSSSSSSSTSSDSQTDSGTSSSAVDFLLQLSEALKPLAAQEVQWVLQQAAQQTSLQRQREMQLVQHQGAQQGQQEQQDTESVQPESATPEQPPLQQQQQQQQNVQLKQDQQKHEDAVADADAVGAESATPEQQQQQQQGTFSSWDWDYQLHNAHTDLLQQLRNPVLQQHLQLESVLMGLSGLLQRLLGVQLLLRPAAPAEAWGQHVRVAMVVQQQQQQQRQQQRQQHLDKEEAAAEGMTAAGCAVEVLGTVYLDVGGGYGTRVLRYTRAEDRSPTTSSVSSMQLSLPAGERISASLQWEQLHAGVQQQLLQQCSSAAAVAVGISGRRIGVQSQAEQEGQQQQQQQSLLQEPPDDDEDDAAITDATSDTARPDSSSSSSSDAVVLSVSQLWELGHEMGHALHLVLSSR